MYGRVSEFRFLGEYAFEGSELIYSDPPYPRRRDGTGLVGAAFFQWVNPKAWLVCVGAISTYLSPGEDLVVQATAFAMVFLVAGFAGSFPWLAFGSFVRRALRDPPAMLARSTSPWRSCL